MQEEKLTLAVLLSKARILEASDTQAKDIEESLMQVETAQLVRNPQLKTCFNCSFSWPHLLPLAPSRLKVVANVGVLAILLMSVKATRNSRVPLTTRLRKTIRKEVITSQIKRINTSCTWKSTSTYTRAFSRV